MKNEFLCDKIFSTFSYHACIEKLDKSETYVPEVYKYCLTKPTSIGISVTMLHFVVRNKPLEHICEELLIPKTLKTLIFRWQKRLIFFIFLSKSLSSGTLICLVNYFFI